MQVRLTGLAATCVAACLLAGCPRATNTSNNSNSSTNANNANSNSTGSTPVVSDFLPTGITLDIAELPEDSDSAAVSALHSGALYDAAVRSASTIVFRFHRMADRAFVLAAAIRHDLTDPAQTQVSGEFTVAGTKVPYKADFAAFDIDGDGTPDGSGNAADLPVAMRIWVDRGDGFEPFLCSLVTVRPSSANVGKGQCYFRPHLIASDAAPAIVHAFVEYDRTDATHLWNRAYYSGAMHPRYTIDAGVAQVDVRTTTGGTIEKTVRSSQDFGDNPYGFTSFQASVHYAIGQPGLLISLSAVKDAAQVDASGDCITLSSREPTGSTQCAAFDTQDNALLPIPTSDPSAFPTDFPATPTF